MVRKLSNTFDRVQVLEVYGYHQLRWTALIYPPEID